MTKNLCIGLSYNSNIKIVLLPCVNIHLEISKVVLLGRVLLAFESKVVWNEGEMLQANQQIDSSFLSPLIIVTLYIRICCIICTLPPQYDFYPRRLIR